MSNKNKLVASIIILFFLLSCLALTQAQTVDVTHYNNSTWILDASGLDYTALTNFLSAAHIGTVDIYGGEIGYGGSTDFTVSFGNSYSDIRAAYTAIKAVLPNENVVLWINDVANPIDVTTLGNRQAIVQNCLNEVALYGVNGISFDIETSTEGTITPHLMALDSLCAQTFHANNTNYFVGIDVGYDYTFSFYQALTGSTINELRIQFYDNVNDFFTGDNSSVASYRLVGTSSEIPTDVPWEIGLYDVANFANDFAKLDPIVAGLSYKPSGYAVYRFEGLTTSQKNDIISYLQTNPLPTPTGNPTPSPSPTASPSPAPTVAPQPLVASPITLNDAILFLALFALLAVAFHTEEPFWFVASGFICIICGIDLELLFANNSALWGLEFIGLIVIGIGCYVFATSLQTQLKTRKTKRGN